MMPPAPRFSPFKAGVANREARDPAMSMQCPLLQRLQSTRLALCRPRTSQLFGVAVAGLLHDVPHPRFSPFKVGVAKRGARDPRHQYAVSLALEVHEPHALQPPEQRTLNAIGVARKPHAHHPRPRHFRP
ncbi:hypothetical protein NDU88_005296 [Pleurodeles waltl]|uniref:Uncharacterized protein n=1 Tax=Pleurodeles waltl TaxID=8319 RepID=A0AAV7SL87_PLEWA|nr:hypothetical protein NDU88_005296 [Pleurodeles waltl]